MTLNLQERETQMNESMKGCRALIAAVATAMLPLAALANEPVDYTPDYTNFMHSGHGGVHDGPLVALVRSKTKQYQDPNFVLDPKYGEPGWDLVTSCVSGNETGAMGIHIVNSSRTTTGEVKPDMPAALIYEPQENGSWCWSGWNTSMTQLRGRQPTPRRHRHWTATS
jgi:hypothetical protein